jgi:hypothetical protein
MLWAVAVVLFVMWAMGFVAFHDTSGFIHLLLVAALFVVVVEFMTGRRAV